MEIVGFHSFFWKDADKISHDRQKKYFLAQICISVPLRRGLFVGGVGLTFFTDVIFFQAPDKRTVLPDLKYQGSNTFLFPLNCPK